MTHQALPAQPSRIRPRRPSSRTTGPHQMAVSAPRSRPQASGKLPRTGELAIDSGDNGRVIDLRREPGAASRLPRGRAGGRYLCCACGSTLIFTGPATPDSGFTPRFRHPGARRSADRCSATAPHQADIQTDLTLVLDLAGQLACALPGAAIWLQADPQLAGQRWDLPPALILRHGAQIVVVERPRRPLSKTLTEARLRDVRSVYGEDTAHWWFFDRDDSQQYIGAGTVRVRPHGKADTHHKVRPTPVQRQLVRSGATVCWVSKGAVLIPYGGHPGTYPARDGEDWSGEMASWAKDWKISHPCPGDGATWWGLVPLPLSGLGHRTGFRPAAAFQLMAALEKAQSGREAHRRRLAREHAQRPGPQTPVAVPVPAAPSRPPAGGAALPQAVQPTQSPAGPPRASLSRPRASRPRFSWRGLLRTLRSGKGTR
ncbi:hypothetical protein AB0K64_29645 [Streptomyces sp. NPDC053741]|uniref:hypothetical protein n=1 Tax=Streptomyces TaxID=1883 RepID=UPI0034475BBE